MNKPTFYVAPRRHIVKSTSGKKQTTVRATTTAATGYLILPWERENWIEIRANINEIDTLMAFDSFICRNLRCPVGNVVGCLRELFNDKYTEEDFTTNMIPWLKYIVLEGRSIFQDPVRILTGKTNQILTLQQTTCLNACLFMGMFNYTYMTDHALFSDSSSSSFDNIYKERILFPISCMLHYFRSRQVEIPNKCVIFIRESHRNAPFLKPAWNEPAILNPVLFGNGPVDQCSSKYKTIGCSKFIGGDLFNGTSSNLLYDELSLFIYTDALVLVLISTEIYDAAYTAVGCAKIVNYTGFGSSTLVTGLTDDAAVAPSAHTSANHTIDKIGLIYINASEQYDKKSQHMDNFMNDLNKAYVGFSSVKTPEADIDEMIENNDLVSASMWNYKSTPCIMSVKFIQLWLAATKANKVLVYHPAPDTLSYFGDFVEFVTSNAMTTTDLLTIYTRVVRRLFSLKKVPVFDTFEEIMYE